MCAKKERGAMKKKASTGRNKWPVHPPVDPASRKRILRILREFSESPYQEYTFEYPLKIEERALIHERCRSMSMTSKGKGKGADRTVVLRKTTKIKSKSMKDNYSSLKFSEESKEVLLDLFTQYPPGQDGLNQLKFNDLCRMKKMNPNKGNDFFSKPVMKREDISKNMKALLSRVKNDRHLAKINEQRSSLPIASYRDAILSEAENHQVVLISGETGCGKTTQVPQFLLDDMWEKGQACKIICTQPRRISATSVAERISQERGEAVGDTVGYKIRMESKGGRQTSLVFCTNGILLRLLVNDGQGSNQGSNSTEKFSTLSELSYIVVDEIHERDHYSDFILAILRDKLPRYPNLRLVLMSATMDIERFSQYFGGCPIIQVPGFTYPVENFYLEDVLSILSSTKNNNNNCATVPSSSSKKQTIADEYRLALDDAIDLAWSNDELDALLELIAADGTSEVLNYQHSRTGVSPLMVFAAKGRAGDICMLLSLGADCLLKAQDGSTALDYANRSKHMEAAEAINRHLENTSPNSKDSQELVDKYLFSMDPDLIDIVLIEKLLRKICMDSQQGAILVFLSSWDDINKTRQRLLANAFFNNPSKFTILPLHSMVPGADQKKVFSRPKHGCRKIVLSTNIAETSVTIDDVVYVIDSGRLKEKSYDPYSDMSSLQSSWVSKASAKQRAGRAGRCQPGVCYRLYSKSQAERFLEYQVPEIKRMPVEELCLQVKMINLDYDIKDFLNKTMDPPVDEAIRNAVAVLKEIGALSDKEKLTQLGYQLGSLPVNPVISKMLFFAILFNCVGPALTLACASDFRDPFILPMLPQERKKATDAKKEFAALYGGLSDQLAVVAAFESWENAKKRGEKEKLCNRYFLSSSTMRMLSDMRQQLLRELTSMGYITNACNNYSREPGILYALLVAGLYPKVGQLISAKKTGKNMRVMTASGDNVMVHPSTVAQKKCKDSALVVYNEITHGDMGVQVKKCSFIRNIALVLIGTDFVVAPKEDNKADGDDDNNNGGKLMASVDDAVLVILDHWLMFNSTALEAAQIYCLRERLAAAISVKATNPRRDLPQALDATVNAIAQVLISDGQSIKSLPSGTAENPGAPAPSEFLKYLFSLGNSTTTQSKLLVTPKNSGTKKKKKSKPINPEESSTVNTSSSVLELGPTHPVVEKPDQGTKKKKKSKSVNSVESSESPGGARSRKRPHSGKLSDS